MSEFAAVLPEILKGLESTYGDEFFNKMTFQLDKVIDADYTFIASIDMAQNIAKTISMVVDGAFVDNFEYDLVHSPCAVVMDDLVCIYPENICGVFPNDKLLVDMGIEGYVGVALHNSRNEIIGIIVALYRTAIKDPQMAKTLFELFSGRIAAEMERAAQSRDLEKLNNELENKVNELVVSEANLQSILNAIPDAIVFTDTERNIISINKGFESVMGYDIDDLSGKTTSLFYESHEEFERQGLINFNRFDAKKRKQYQLRYRRKDGSMYTGETLSAAVDSPGGQLLGYIGVTKDITERRKNEEKLELAASVFTHAREGIVITDATYRIIEVNDPLTEMTGYPREELIGQPLSLFQSDRQSPEFYAELTQSIITTGHWMGEVWNRRKDGKDFAGLQNIDAVYDENGVVKNYVAMCSDITVMKEYQDQLARNYQELNQANTLLRAVNESSRDLQFILDRDGVVTDYHAHEQKDLYLDPENFMGKKMQEVVPKKIGEQFQSAFDAALSCNSLVSFEYVLHMPTGDFTYEARIVSLVDERLVVTVRNITERIQMEADILNARKLESIGVLAGGIAHDFNNILAGLFGNIELAKMKLPEGHAAYPYIETATQAFERATLLTQQLLTFAKGGVPLLESVNVKQIIRESLEFNLSGSNVRGVLNLPDNLWQGKVDKGQISQVVGNLTINAKQAMPNGGVLTIDAENVKDIKDKARPNLSGDYVKIIMRDEGEGISDKYIEKIFDPYFTTKQAGSGLGLATVHSIVTKHNGHISIESKIGIGTTFTLYLPAEKNLHDSADTAPARVTEKPNSQLGRILVMDDEESIRELFSSMLESCGYCVNCAAGGDEALDKYICASKSGNPFDLVITDLTIPGGKGGKEVMTELLVINPLVKVVVSSGYATDPIMANYADYGFSGRLAKPFKLADMDKEISRVMDLS